MATILITSGPTRQYLDPVRYLTNASSGLMGKSLAEAALEAGHQVLIVSGPVEVTYPAEAEVHPVISTEEMLQVAQQLFQECDGVIGAAAPCDYRPQLVAEEKIAKTGEPLKLELIETPDVIATLGGNKRENQWAVGFALETNDARFRALTKLERKSCDLMVLNGPEAMNALNNEVQILNAEGTTLSQIKNSKQEVAREILKIIGEHLISPKS